VARSQAISAFFLLGLAVMAGAPGHAQGQDFDPAGRRRRPAPAPAAPHGEPAPAAPHGAPAPRTPKADGTTRPAAPSAPKGPSNAALIARYTAVVLAQPASPFPLSRLMQLYRERDGNAKQLVADFEKRASEPGAEQWNARIVLAAIYQQEGRADDAQKAYEAAIAERPKDPTPLLALARLAKDRGDLPVARRTFEQALPLLGAQDREQALRALIGVLLDLKDFDAAKLKSRELLRLGQGSIFVRAELGRELFQRGELERAEAEFREVVQASAGDNRTLAPALRDLGKVLAKQHKNEEALSTLKKALVAAGSEAGVRGEIFTLITDVYRSENNLAELIRLLESEHPGDFPRLVALGALYEETGDVDKALATYRRALGTSPRNIDVRLKVIHLLQAEGELELATTEYETLIRAAPRNPDYVFELCETLLQRGERQRALTLLTQLEQRAAADEEVLARLAEFYERVEEKQKSIAVLTRLSSIAPSDPTHLVDLGDRYFQQGDKKRAVETWLRIKVVVPNHAKALATLGDVYLEHDMLMEGIEALKEASQLDPQNLGYKKAYAAALERTATAAGATSLAAQRYEEARAIWEGLLAGSAGDKNLAREARTHIATLWSLLRQLEQHVAPLEKRLASEPPDLEAGRLLAEVQTRLHRLTDAEATLRRVIKSAPGDAESYLALERVLVLERNLDGAIQVLEKLADIDPRRAREFYQRMAQYAAELYRDDAAIAYAARAVQLSPEDADGHKKLGEMYAKKQDTARAIAEYRAAIAKNDKLYPVYFPLAELLLSQGDAEEADRLFRRVLRAAPDEELVAQAARQSMQINLGRGTLESLEKDLLPVAIGNPRKPIYRRLLVEMYGAMAFSLIQEVRHGTPEGAAAARRTLTAIGTRAVKPLLDALADDREAQQRIAVDLLAFVDNKSAGPALFAFATGLADQPLRVQAMIACGALRDAALLPKYETLLVPKNDTAITPGDPLAVAAAWGVARLGDKKATPLLSAMLTKGTPEVRALAALGLGMLHEARSAPELSKVARSLDAGNLARAAAAFALGELSATQAADSLREIAQGGDSLPRQAAIVALARLGGEKASSAIANAVLSEDPALRDSAVLAALVLQTGKYRGPQELLPVPDGAPDLRTILISLHQVLAAYTPAERARALVAQAPVFRTAADNAALSSERARVLADALLARDGKPSFAPFTDKIDQIDPALRDEAEQAAESIAAFVVRRFVDLSRGPGMEVRARAVQFLARRKEDPAQEELARVLGAPDEAMQRVALAAVTSGVSEGVIRAVAALVRPGPSWPLRVRAAEALGRIGPPARTGAGATLGEAATKDDYSLVREAALRALSSVDRKTAEQLLVQAARSDPEERIRSVAKELLLAKPAP
jgi:cellulose synthase operon protein C